MKKCNSCGYKLDNKALFCPNCGTKIQENNEKNISEKKQNKKIITIVLGLIAIFCCIVFLIYPRLMTENKAKKLVNNCISKIEEKNLNDVINCMGAEAFINKNIIDEFLDYDSIINLYKSKSIGDEEDIKEALDELNINFSDVKINNLRKFDFNEYIDGLDSKLKYYSNNKTISMVDCFNGILGEDVNTTRDIYKKLRSKLDDCDINIRDMYIVDLSFSVSVEYGKNTGTLIYWYLNKNIRFLKDYVDLYNEIKEYLEDKYMFCDDETYTNIIDSAVLFRYENEWRVIPLASNDMIVKEAVNILKEHDINTARHIKTAIETTMSSETVYEELTFEHPDELFVFTDEGMSSLSDEFVSEVKRQIQETPTIAYNISNTEKYAFSVSKGGCVVMYVINSEGQVFEIYPECDEVYELEEIN